MCQWFLDSQGQFPLPPFRLPTTLTPFFALCWCIYVPVVPGLTRSLSNPFFFGLFRHSIHEYTFHSHIWYLEFLTPFSALCSCRASGTAGMSPSAIMSPGMSQRT